MPRERILVTDEQRALLHQHFKTHSYIELATLLGWSRSKVIREVKREGLSKTAEKKADPKGRVPYTDKEIEYIRTYAPTLGVELVARKLGRTVYGIRTIVVRLGVRLAAHENYSAAEDAYLKERYGSMSYQQIANVLGRTQEAVRARARVLGLTGRQLQAGGHPAVTEFVGLTRDERDEVHAECLSNYATHRFFVYAVNQRQYEVFVIFTGEQEQADFLSHTPRERLATQVTRRLSAYANAPASELMVSVIVDSRERFLTDYARLKQQEGWPL